MKKCPYCERNNEDEAKVCTHCFAAFPGNGENAESEPEEPEAELTATRKRKRS